MKKTFIDQMQRTVEIPFPPKRIISLVPSQSELLWDLGLQKELAGITKFCIHPQEMFEGITRVGGTKKINKETIIQINPDLIIGNKEENTPEDITWLEGRFPVWMSDVNSYSDALDMIKAIGEITDRVTKAAILQNEIERAFNQVPTPARPVRVIYLIWKDPFMCVGQNTFINDMLKKAGLKNLITQSRYPVITVEEIKKLQPDLLILSTEPFPFKNEDVNDFKTKLTGTRVWLGDGEMFSWYGSRLKKSAAYFTHQAETFSA